MSKRELGRVEVLARVRSQELRLVDAAALLHVSYRQAKRLWKRYGEEGAAGLKQRSAGRRSNRAYPEKFRRKVLGLVRKKYRGPVGERFGPTLAAEHLAAEDGLELDAETLRRWMLAAGLWSRERRRRRHRRRRERKEHFGEMVQMDGSFHPWLEERGPEGCLMDLVDDATNTTLARLGEEETIWAAAEALRAWIERYGVPEALYVDWKNLYKRCATAQEGLRGEEPIRQFGRMCGKLGIGWGGTTTGFSSSSPRVARMGRRGGKGWSASGPGGGWRSSIAVTRCRGARSRPPPGQASPRRGRRSSELRDRLRPSRSGNGCRRRITRGDRRPAEGRRGERRA